MKRQIQELLLKHDNMINESTKRNVTASAAHVNAVITSVLLS